MVIFEPQVDHTAMGHRLHLGGSPMRRERGSLCMETENLRSVKLVPYPHQVGGHVGLMTLDEKTICKPQDSGEQIFYESLPPELEAFVPRFKGIADVYVEEQGDGYLDVMAYPFFEETHSTSEDSEEVESQTTNHRKKDAKYRTSYRVRISSSGNLRIDQDSDGDDLFEEVSLESSVRRFGCNPWSMHCHRRQVSKMHYTQQDIKCHKFLLLENMTHKYKYPCILDLKMGVRSFGDDQSDEKKKSHMEKVNASTSAKLGIRICGMQVFRRDKARFHCKNKYFGRGLSEEGLKTALKLFLFNGYDFRIDLVEDFITRIKTLLDTLSNLDSYRFFGSSLLLIYEGGDEDIKRETNPDYSDSDDDSDEYHLDNNASVSQQKQYAATESWVQQEHAAADPWFEQELATANPWFEQEHAAANTWVEEEHIAANPWFDQKHTTPDPWHKHNSFYEETEGFDHENRDVKSNYRGTSDEESHAIEKVDEKGYMAEDDSGCGKSSSADTFSDSESDVWLEGDPDITSDKELLHDWTSEKSTYEKEADILYTRSFNSSNDCQTNVEHCKCDKDETTVNNYSASASNFPDKSEASSYQCKSPCKFQNLKQGSYNDNTCPSLFTKSHHKKSVKYSASTIKDKLIDLSGPTIDLKMIDFAHACLPPEDRVGQQQGYKGPDKGYIYGLENLLHLLGQIHEEYREDSGMNYNDFENIL